MSSTHRPIHVQAEREPARLGEVHWVWPAATRGLLAAAVIAAAAGLGVANRSVPRAGEAIVAAPDLLVDINTVPAAVLETLPHVGQALVRQLIAARETRPIISLDDAGSRIRGLGPATRALIAPYLRFEPGAQANAANLTLSFVERPVATEPGSRGKTPTRSRKRKSATLKPRLVTQASM